MSVTTKFRVVFLVLFCTAVVTTFVAWIAFQKDPAGVIPLLQILLGAVVTGELANVGKRATYKREAVDGADSV